MPRSSPFPYLLISWPCKQISILSGMCTCGLKSLHPLTACFSLRIQGALFSASMQRFRKPCAVLHCPSMGPYLQEWAPIHVGSKPLVSPTSPGPTSAPIHAGSRATGPACPKCQKSGRRELAPSSKAHSKGPHTKQVTSPYVLQRSTSLQLSIPGPTSSPSTSHVSVLGQTGPCNSTSFVALFLRLSQADRPCGWLLCRPLCRHPPCFLLTFHPP